MAEHQLAKFNHIDISAILQQLELPEATQSHIEPTTPDIGIITQLIDLNELDAAIRFLALGLPAREGIWWSHLAATKTESKLTCVKTQNTLKNTAEWVKHPSEERRIAAKKLAQDLELTNAASWSAMGIFWSGGNIAPKGQPTLEPELFMRGHATANSIILSAECTTTTTDTKKYFLKQGLHIAMGGNGKID